MNEIHISRTNQTPEFIFKPDGIIKIVGRGLFNDKPEVTDQLISWINDYLRNPAKVTYVTIAFEYLNSLSTIILVNILQSLSQITRQSKTLVIKWYYEDDDEEILERGKYISFSFDIPIEFIITDDIADC
jgi:SiaC family regulatory phosphoprotein